MKNLTITTQVKMIDSNATGAMYRKQRLDRKLRIEDVAPNAGLSLAKLARLERGEADWNEDIALRVKTAIRKG